MVQKSEELHKSGAAPYSDASCAVVCLVSTNLAWSDRTVPASAASPHMHARISLLCMLLHICWVAYFQVLN